VLAPRRRQVCTTGNPTGTSQGVPAGIPEKPLPKSPPPQSSGGGPLPPVINSTSVVRGTLIGKLEDLTEAERKAAEYLLSQGRNVEIVPRGANRTPDFKIDGVLTELKTLTGVVDQTSNGLSSAMASRIMDGRGQAEHILVDVSGQAGMTIEVARRGIVRAYGADNKLGKKINSIRVIGNGFDILTPRMP